MAKKKKPIVKKVEKIVPKPVFKPKPKPVVVVPKVDQRLLCTECGCQPEPKLRVSDGAGVMLCRKCYKDK